MVVQCSEKKFLFCPSGSSSVCPLAWCVRWKIVTVQLMLMRTKFVVYNAVLYREECVHRESCVVYGEKCCVFCRTLAKTCINCRQLMGLIKEVDCDDRRHMRMSIYCCSAEKWTCRLQICTVHEEDHQLWLQEFSVCTSCIWLRNPLANSPAFLWLFSPSQATGGKWKSGCMDGCI